jgi:hypothetical protein
MTSVVARDSNSNLSSAQIAAIAGLIVAVAILYWIVTALVIAKFRLGDEGYWRRFTDVLFPCSRFCGGRNV